MYMCNHLTLIIIAFSDINFTIDFLNQPGPDVMCRGPANFDEGVELAVSNPDRSGEWILLLTQGLFKSMASVLK